MKYQYNTWELNFDRIKSFDIAATVSILQNIESPPTPSEEYVWWHPFGNYVMWSDGGGTTYYFCKKYLRINGWDFTTKAERQLAFDYLNGKQLSRKL